MKAPAKSSATKNAGWFWKYFPFWMFLAVFKLGAGLHFSIVAPLGERLLPVSTVGVLVGLSALVQLMCDVPAGYLLDRFGYRRMLLLGGFIFLVASLVLLLGLTPFTYGATLLFGGLGWVFFGPGVGAYVLTHAPKKRAGGFISSRNVFESLGIVIAATLLPFALSMNVASLGILISSLLALGTIFIALSPPDPKRSAARLKSTVHRSNSYLTATIRSVRALNPASTMLLLHGLAASIFYGTIWFVIPLVIAHEARAGWLSLGLGVFDFGVVLLGSLIGYLVDRFDRRVMIFFGLLIFALTGVLLGLTTGPLFVLIGFIATTGDEFAGISLWAWLHDLDRDHEHDGAVSGVINLFQDLGWAIGPMIAGFVYALFGPTWAIVSGALPIIFTWLAYLLVLVGHGEPALAKTTRRR